MLYLSIRAEVRGNTHVRGEDIMTLPEAAVTQLRRKSESE